MKSVHTDTRQNAEILRIARLLRKDPKELGFLQAVDDRDLLLFREQATEALFDAHTGMLKRMAAGAKLLPAAALAKIAEAVFGPLLCARIAGLIEPSKAVETAKRLSPDFLADVAAELDPRRSERIISSIPVDTVCTVAVELADREDWLTLGRFVGHLSDEPLRAALDALDDSSVLRAAFAVEDRSAIASVIDLISSERRGALLRTATESDLWPMLLGIGGELRDDQRTELAELAAEQDGSVLDQMVRSAEEHNLWDLALPLAAELPLDAQTAVAERVGRLSAKQRAAIMLRAEAIGLADQLGAIGEALSDEAA